MQRLTITPAMHAAIYSDPPPDPVALRLHATGLRREHLDLANILEATHARPLTSWTRGTRFELLAATGKIYTREPADAAAIDAVMNGRPGWEKRGESWHNHVARLRVKDNELIVHISQEAYSAYEEE